MDEELKLFEIADKLDELAKNCPNEELSKLSDAAEQAGKSWSGSWLGYQSRIYYKNLQTIPPGARFSKEYGTMEMYGNTTAGEWVEYDFDELVKAIKKRSGVKDIPVLEESSKNIAHLFEEYQSQILSIVIPKETDGDSFLKEQIKNIKDESVIYYGEWIKAFMPQGQQISRDMNAIGQGYQAPAHISVIAEVEAIRSPYKACSDLCKFTRRVASHIENINKSKAKSARIGTNIFIGHGRSMAWRDLKDFIQERLHLPWDEFNHEPIAGLTNITRLSQMLDKAAMAFLIMTAEDEQADGKMAARMNVIHEVGLFQGRLGFEKAIVLLEEGCEEFSNIQGLGQIRFPKGNIKAVLEEIRRVLEREDLLN